MEQWWIQEDGKAGGTSQEVMFCFLIVPHFRDATATNISWRQQASSPEVQLFPSGVSQAWAQLNFFRLDAIQSQNVLIPTQRMTHNGFKELIQIVSRLEMIFWNLIQINSWLKWLSRILIQIDSRLERLSRSLILLNHDSESFLECWFESTHDAIISLWFGPITHWICLGRYDLFWV